MLLEASIFSLEDAGSFLLSTKDGLETHGDAGLNYIALLGMQIGAEF